MAEMNSVTDVTYGAEYTEDGQVGEVVPSEN